MSEPFEPDQKDSERQHLRDEVRESIRQWRHGRPHDERTAWDHDLEDPHITCRQIAVVGLLLSLALLAMWYTK